MKKNIYITGLVCLSVTLIAIVSKISHWPGAGILLLAGVGSLALIFLPIVYLSAIKSTEDKLLKFLFTAALISFSLDFVGMLFKIMHWPGAGILMMIGIPLPFILFLPAYIYYHIKRKLKTDLNFFAVLLFMIYVGVFSSLLALKPSVEIFDSCAYSANRLSESNQYLSANSFETDPSEISNSSKQLVSQIEEIKHQLLISTEQENMAITKLKGSIDYSTIRMKDMRISIELLNELGFNKFNKDFEAFSKSIAEKSPNSDTRRLIDEINTYRLEKDPSDAPLIAKLPMILAMNILTDWQNKLLLINYMQGLKSI